MMAFGGSCSCRSSWRNLSLTDLVEEGLARDPGQVKDPHLGSTSSTLFYNPTLGSTLVSALVSTLVATNDLFKQFMRAYLKLNKGSSQLSVQHKQPFIAKIPEIYYGKLHMDCYYFCQQCKDYFETSEATRAARTPFAAFFLYENISMRWTQYKHCH